MITKDHFKATVPAFGRAAIFFVVGCAILLVLAWWATNGFTNHLYGVEWIDSRFDQKSTY